MAARQFVIRPAGFKLNMRLLQLSLAETEALRFVRTMYKVGRIVQITPLDRAPPITVRQETN